MIGELLLARTVEIIRALTPEEKLPDESDSLDPTLFDLVKELSALDSANEPRRKGRKPKKDLGSLAELSPKRRGRKPDLDRNRNDEAFLRIVADARAAPDGKKRSFRKILPDLARKLARIGCKGQGPSAAEIKECEDLLASKYPKALDRYRHRLRRQRTNSTEIET